MAEEIKNVVGGKNLPVAHPTWRRRLFRPATIIVYNLARSHILIESVSGMVKFGLPIRRSPAWRRGIAQERRARLFAARAAVVTAPPHACSLSRQPTNAMQAVADRRLSRQ